MISKVKRNISIVCIVQLMMLALMQPMSVLADDAATEQELLIDRFGQFIRADYPTKIKNDEQLKATVETEKAYYDSLSVPQDRDEFGGLKDSKGLLGLETTGFFHIEKTSDGKFVMVDPIGNLYFSVGVCGFGYEGDTYTLIEGREHIYEWLPEFSPDSEFYTAYRLGNKNHFSHFVANWIKKYGKPFTLEEFTNQSIERLKKWGFNSGGAWSNKGLMAQGVPQFLMLRMPKETVIAGTNLYDVFADDWVQTVENAIKGDLITYKDNNSVIGYFIDNELQFVRLAEVVPKAKASEVACKRKLVDMLKGKYESDIAAFNAAWQMTYKDFDEIYEATNLAIKTDQAQKDFNEYIELYMDTLYGTTVEIARKYAPNHMIVGDRLANNTPALNMMAARIAGKYCDIISYNYYCYDLDMDMLKSLVEVSGRPLMLTEFHYGEPTQGFLATGQMLKDKEAQGLGYRNYVEKCAASGFIVGTHWFEYTDMSATGRYFGGYSGTAAAVGLIDVADQPHLPLVNAMKQTNDNIYDFVFVKKEPYQYDGFPVEKGEYPPLQIPKIQQPIVIDGVMDSHWPEGDVIILEDMHRVLGVYEFGLGTEARFAWDEETLYMYANILDLTPMTNQRKGHQLWNGDGIELFFGPEKDKMDQGGSLVPKDSQLLIGANKVDGEFQYFWANNRSDQPLIEVYTMMNADKNGYIVEAAIPFKALHIDDPSDGREFRFDFAFDNGTSLNHRIHQFVWNGGKYNSIDRTEWGRAILVGSYKGTASNTEVKFDDLDTVPWAKECIEELTKRNIVAGVGGNKFEPNSNVTRAAFTKMLMEALGMVDETAQTDFTDVYKDAWSYKYIASAQKSNIINGNADGTFRPDDAITRQQMAAIAYRAAKAVGIEFPLKVSAVNFEDQQDIEQYAKEAVMELQQAEIISGYNNRFAPNDNTTRAQAAKIIYMLLELN